MQVNSNIIKDNFLGLFSKYMYMLPIIKKKITHWQYMYK